MADLGYAVLSGLCRLVSRVFFRRIEIEGLDRLPSKGPLLLVSNHGNSLIDPMVLLAFVPRRLRFLAKSTLWDTAVLRPLLAMADPIPVYRRQDAGVDTSRNVEAFARCWEALAEGEAIALFPEGKSHGEPSLQPLKTGAARIALDAEDHHGPLGTLIVPVGLIFEDRHAFRSRVLIRVGRPVDPAAEIARARSDHEGAFRALTERIGDALSRLAPNYRSWREARLVQRAAAIWARPEIEVPTRDRMAAAIPVSQAFAEGYRELAAAQPERVEALAARVERYDRALELCGLTDEQVASSYVPAQVLRYLLTTVPRLLVWLPVSLVGIALNWLPYRIPGWVARALRQPPHVAATYKVIVSVVVFPLFWLLEAGAVWRWLGALEGLLTLVVAPLSGWFALKFSEHLTRFRGEARAFMVLRSGQRVARELSGMRREIYDETASLARLLEN